VTDKVSFCPAADEPGAGGFGGAGLAWTMVAQEPVDKPAASPQTAKPEPKPLQFTGSYGFNGWLFRWDAGNRGGQDFSGGAKEIYLTPSAKESSLVPVFADAAWLDGWPRVDDPTPPNLTDGHRSQQGPGVAPKENMMGRFTIARHGKAINIVFLDGHGERVELVRLKRLNWHNGFVYQDWAPPLPRK
jgi:prepilin-type processing-associated H-X9-DG protein